MSSRSLRCTPAVGSGGCLRSGAIEPVTKTVKAAAGEHERVLVVPYNLGMQYTSMMSSWSWMKCLLQSIDGVVANGNGVLPHRNWSLQAPCRPSGSRFLCIRTAR